MGNGFVCDVLFISVLKKRGAMGVAVCSELMGINGSIDSDEEGSERDGK